MEIGAIVLDPREFNNFPITLEKVYSRKVRLHDRILAAFGDFYEIDKNTITEEFDIYTRLIFVTFLCRSTVKSLEEERIAFLIENLSPPCRL